VEEGEEVRGNGQRLPYSDKDEDKDDEDDKNRLFLIATAATLTCLTAAETFCFPSQMPELLASSQNKRLSPGSTRAGAEVMSFLSFMKESSWGGP
jgi:hypothetical protein